MGSNRRYGDQIAQQKDNARAEAKALTPASLPLELVTTAGGPVTTSRQPLPVLVFVEVAGTVIRLHAVATAWNARCVLVQWTGTGPEPRTAWVWASAVQRLKP